MILLDSFVISAAVFSSRDLRLWARAIHSLDRETSSDDSKAFLGCCCNFLDTHFQLTSTIPGKRIEEEGNKIRDSINREETKKLGFVFLEDRSLQIGAKKRKKTLEHKSQEKTQSEARFVSWRWCGDGQLGSLNARLSITITASQGQYQVPTSIHIWRWAEERKIERKTPSSACFRHTQTLEQTLVCAIDSCKLLSYV